MDDKFEIFKELLELSRDEKRGLTIFIGGQTIAGVVTKITETKAVEVRSRCTAARSFSWIRLTRLPSVKIFALLLV